MTFMLFPLCESIELHRDPRLLGVLLKLCIVETNSKETKNINATNFIRSLANTDFRGCKPIPRRHCYPTTPSNHKEPFQTMNESQRTNKQIGIGRQTAEDL